MARAAVSAEQSAKMQEAAAAYRADKAAMRQRRLTVGAWMVYRADEWNIVVQKGDDGEQFFYPDMPSAIRGLFRKLVEPKGKADCAALAKQVANAEAAILAALTQTGMSL